MRVCMCAWEFRWEEEGLGPVPEAHRGVVVGPGDEGMPGLPSSQCRGAATRLGVDGWGAGPCVHGEPCRGRSAMPSLLPPHACRTSMGGGPRLVQDAPAVRVAPAQQDRLDALIAVAEALAPLTGDLASRRLDSGSDSATRRGGNLSQSSSDSDDDWGASALMRWMGPSGDGDVFRDVPAVPDRMGLSDGQLASLALLRCSCLASEFVDDVHGISLTRTDGIVKGVVRSLGASLRLQLGPRRSKLWLALVAVVCQELLGAVEEQVRATDLSCTLLPLAVLWRQAVEQFVRHQAPGDWHVPLELGPWGQARRRPRLAGRRSLGEELAKAGTVLLRLAALAPGRLERANLEHGGRQSIDMPSLRVAGWSLVETAAGQPALRPREAVAELAAAAISAGPVGDWLQKLTALVRVRTLEPSSRPSATPPSAVLSGEFIMREWLGMGMWVALREVLGLGASLGEVPTARTHEPGLLARGRNEGKRSRRQDAAVPTALPNACAFRRLPLLSQSPWLPAPARVRRRQLRRSARRSWQRRKRRRVPELGHAHQTACTGCYGACPACWGTAVPTTPPCFGSWPTRSPTACSAPGWRRAACRPCCSRGRRNRGSPCCPPCSC